MFYESHQDEQDHGSPHSSLYAADTDFRMGEHDFCPYSGTQPEIFLSGSLLRMSADFFRGTGAHKEKGL